MKGRFMMLLCWNRLRCSSSTKQQMFGRIPRDVIKIIYEMLKLECADCSCDTPNANYFACEQCEKTTCGNCMNVCEDCNQVLCQSCQFERKSCQFERRMTYFCIDCLPSDSDDDDYGL